MAKSDKQKLVEYLEGVLSVMTNTPLPAPFIMSKELVEEILKHLKARSK